MDDKALFMTLLLDFFGDILTDKQREYLDLYHNEDLSLSEIAERAGISRQGVYDMVTRAEKSLEELERKTGVVNRWLTMNQELERAEGMAKKLAELCDDSESAALASDLAETLKTLISTHA